MGQVGLSDMFMKEQITNVSTNYMTFNKSIEQNTEHTFGKELHKVKNLQSERKDKSDVTKIEDYASQERMKEVKEKIKTTEDFNESEIKIESKDENEDDIDQDNQDEKILLLLSQNLNVPVDELKELLSQMGYTASDLLKQENFGKFVNEVYSKIKDQDLLMIEDGAKSISILFNQLQAMSDETKFENNSLTVQEQVYSKIGTNKSFEKMEESTQDFYGLGQIDKIDQIDQQINGRMIENAPIQHISQINKFQDIEEFTKVLNPASTDEVNKIDIGMVVPVQNFSSTIYTQLGRAEGSTAMQVPQLIEMDIVDQIDFKLLGSAKEIHLQLSPKELGELSIKLIEENSTVVAHIKVDNEKTKLFLLNQLGDLKTALEERGLTIIDVKVDINQDTRQSQMEQERQKSSKRIQEIISKHLKEFEQEEENISEKTNDSEVDYMV